MFRKYIALKSARIPRDQLQTQGKSKAMRSTVVRTESFQVNLKSSRTTSRVQAQLFEMRLASNRSRVPVAVAAGPAGPTKNNSGAEGAQLTMLPGQGQELWHPKTTIQSGAGRIVPTPAVGVSAAPTPTMRAEMSPTAQGQAKGKGEANMRDYL